MLCIMGWEVGRGGKDGLWVGGLSLPVDTGS